MKKNFEEFYDKVTEYGGWQQVPAQRIYAIFEEILEPAKIGFQVVKPGLLARPINDQITHVIKLRARKGASYDICFGVSLSYVPYPYVPKVKWHRTQKSANLDLFEQPQVDWKPKEGDAADNANPYLAGVMLGEKCFADELSHAWEKTFALAILWFESARSLEGILQRCAEHLSRKHDGIRYLPGARLVNAFTLGALGRLDEARTELQKFLAEYGESTQARANLEAALQQITSRKH